MCAAETIHKVNNDYEHTITLAPSLAGKSGTHPCSSV